MASFQGLFTLKNLPHETNSMLFIVSGLFNTTITILNKNNKVMTCVEIEDVV